jgi:imidazolonepropionase-like amidohydrolase
MRSAVGLGLPVAFGTDAGVIPHGRNAEEFAYLTRIGLTPIAAIRSATQEAAQVIGLGDRIGSLTAGKLADLIAVDGNPLDDLTSLKRVVFVMRNGQIFRQPSGGVSAPPAPYLRAGSSFLEYFSNQYRR